MSSQIPIPDQLMAIRQKIAALEADGRALRKILIRDPSARIGGDYVATVRTHVTYQVKSKELEKANPDLFAQLATETVQDWVLLTRRLKT